MLSEHNAQGAGLPADVKASLIDGGVIAIVRGDFRGEWLDIAAALVEAGVPALEVTLNSPAALDAIAALAHSYGARLLIGAGTVLDPADVSRVADAGGQFIVAPNVDVGVINAAHAAQRVMVPGAYTASEVVAAWNHGASMVKLFPATLGGPAYLRALRGPLDQIPLIPTGGISLDNAAAFVSAGAVALGVGSSLINPDVHTAGGMTRLQERAGRLMQIVAEARASLPGAVHA